MLMKLSLLLGHSGTGKTHCLIENIKRDVEAGRRVFLLVPEQQSFSAEKRLLSILPPSAQLNVEVLSFSRLANRVFRQYGGLSYHYATPGVRALLMWRDICELSPLLEEYGASSDSSRSISDGALTELMLSAVDELKAYGISPAHLEHAADKLAKDSPLRAKLRDIALLCAAFQNHLSERYDDMSDDLARLEDVLSRYAFFKDAQVYLDYFTSFTAREYAVIARILPSADKVTLALGCEEVHENALHLSTLTDTLKRFYRLAEKAHCPVECHVLRENHRAANAELALIEKELWRLDHTDVTEPISEKERGNVKLWRCVDPYEEAEAVCCLISSLIRQGYRYRDIVVIPREISDYSGILNVALEKYQIPAFFSEKTDLSTLPPVKLLQSALLIIRDNFRTTDVISHIKTGLCPLPQDKLDAFESYITTWRLHGADFLREEWKMNPDGYVALDHMSDRAKAVLQAANEVRATLIAPLLTLRDELKNAQNVPDMCAALYRYTEAIHMKEALRAQAEKRWHMGPAERIHATELLRLYDVVLNVLEDLAHALPETVLSITDFATALKLVFDRTEVASIPDTADQVLVGSASMLRTDEPKVAILIGLCENTFPRAVSDDGIFTDADKAQLSELGLSLSPDTGARSADELYFVYRAMTCPTERLFLLTHDTDCDGKGCRPSIAFLRVSHLLSYCSVEKYTALPVRERLFHPETAFERLAELSGTPEGAALRALLTESPQYTDRVNALSLPVSMPECQIRPETARIVFPRKLSLSQTRLEKYVLCRFGYYCSYVLNLKEEKTAKVRYNDIGTYVHAVMEAFFRRATQDGHFDTNNMTAGEIEVLVDHILEDYLHSLCPDGQPPSNRLLHLFSRLRRLTLLMIENLKEEFSHSAFVPAFFELHIRENVPGAPAPMEIALDNGEKVSLGGIVDRVDLFRHEGDLYLRVVDYKTGSKDFSLKDVQNGLGVQLLLYLYTLLENSPPEMLAKMGLAENGKLRPAGVLYLSANVPPINIDCELSQEEIFALAEDKLERHGLILNDPMILQAMNDQLSPSFLGDIKKKTDKKQGTEALTGSGLVSNEDFIHIGEELKQTIRNIVSSMKQGRADALPHTDSKWDPCSVCRMKAVCRSAVPGRQTNRSIR